jgi:hypothetical protein
MNQINIESSKLLSWMYKNPHIKATLLVLLGLFFVVSPKIPDTIRLLYNNVIFRIMIILLIIFLSVHDYQLAIMVTIVYLLTLQKLNTNENFENNQSNQSNRINNFIERIKKFATTPSSTPTATTPTATSE